MGCSMTVLRAGHLVEHVQFRGLSVTQDSSFVWTVGRNDSISENIPAPVDEAPERGVFAVFYTKASLFKADIKNMISSNWRPR